MYDILYNKRKHVFGYFKISAIKPSGWVWGRKELESTFGILKLELTDQQVSDWSNLNKYCVNQAHTNIEETPKQYQIDPVVVGE